MSSRDCPACLPRKLNDSTIDQNRSNSISSIPSGVIQNICFIYSDIRNQFELHTLCLFAKAPLQVRQSVRGYVSAGLTFVHVSQINYCKLQQPHPFIFVSLGSFTICTVILDIDYLTHFHNLRRGNLITAGMGAGPWIPWQTLYLTRRTSKGVLYILERNYDAWLEEKCITNHPLQ